MEYSVSYISLSLIELKLHYDVIFTSCIEYYDILCLGELSGYQRTYKRWRIQGHATGLGQDHLRYSKRNNLETARFLGNGVAPPTGNTFTHHLQDPLVPQNEGNVAAPQDREMMYHQGAGSLAARQNAERVDHTHTGKTRTDHGAVEVGSNGNEEVKMTTRMRGRSIEDLIEAIEESKIAKGLNLLFIMEAKSLKAIFCPQREPKRRKKRTGLR